jgi:hypothetical protein
MRLGEGTDIKYYNYADMISICEVFLNTRNSTYIADTFIFEFGEIATICGSRISSAEV